MKETFVMSIFITMAIGWVGNIVALFKDFYWLTQFEVLLHIVGIPVVPLGSLLGILWITAP